MLNRDKLKIGASVENIIGFNNYLYIATSDANAAFQVLRNDTINSTASSSPSLPVVVETFGLSSRGVALTCNSKVMYVVTQNDQDFFHIYHAY
jgi:hypothetical protein